jgi:hypothetical protein
VSGQQPLRAMSNGCCGNEVPFTFRLCAHGYNLARFLGAASNKNDAVTHDAPHLV